ncbi:cytochrome P450 [Imperialibacter roseus]|uniref:Cytochrome P450 n=1 Tax=Imperialibacter roseus TaxID=1324217 RepID=A0ABZ0IPT2_9BACT|nr:cytochrome P450 [Imperialibacter roseus]WOK07052.1 cytochrome P450 [Imperialibacter roseus]
MDVTKLWQPSKPGFITNPYPVYSNILAHTPVFESPTGDFVVMNYDGVKHVLFDKNYQTGARAEWVYKMTQYATDRNIDFRSIQQAVAGMPIQQNPPIHSVIRSVLAKNWPSKAFLSTKSSEICDEILADMPPSFDLVSFIAKKLPVWMVCDVLGMPRSLGEELQADGFRLVQLLDPYLTFKDLKNIQVASTNLRASFDLYYSSLDKESAGLAAAVKKAAEDNPEFNADPVSLIIFLFIAAFETTSSLISICLQTLIEDKELCYQLDSDARIERFVREILRLYSPVQITGRSNPEPIVLSGVEIPANSTITLCLGSANRDPGHFENPDQLIIDRKVNDHLSFGYGMHHCLGSQMAVVEAASVVKAFLPKLGHTSIVGKPVWENRLMIRRLLSMELLVSDNETPSV